MPHRKFSAAHKKAIGDVMRAARKRKPTGGHVKFTKGEKSTLREVMLAHHARGRTVAKKPAARKTTVKRKATSTRKPAVRRKSTVRKSTVRKSTIKHTAGKRGRKVGFKHSAATRKKMSASHRARHVGKKTARKR